MLAGLRALRADRVAQPSSLTGAAVLGRAVRVLRTPTQPRARCAPTQEQKPSHVRLCRRRGLTAARFKPTPLHGIGNSKKRVSRTRPNRLPTDTATRAIPLRRACARASPLGLRPNTPERAPGGSQAHADGDWKERSTAPTRWPLRGESDTRHHPNDDHPFLQNRSCLLTCAPVWAKKCIKGFFEDRRTRVRAASTRQAAPHQGLAPSAVENRVGSECSR